MARMQSYRFVPTTAQKYGRKKKELSKKKINITNKTTIKITNKTTIKITNKTTIKITKAKKTIKITK